MSTIIQVIEGVTGGFLPAVPKRQVIIDLEGNYVRITKYLKSNDTGAIDGYLQHTTQENFARYFLYLFSKEITLFVEESLKVIQSLPMEEPSGCEDVYGIDTSIMIDSPNFKWQNRPNEGCAITESTVKPTAEQVKLFTSMVFKIFELANHHCNVLMA